MCFIHKDYLGVFVNETLVEDFMFGYHCDIPVNGKIQAISINFTHSRRENTLPFHMLILEEE